MSSKSGKKYCQDDLSKAVAAVKGGLSFGKAAKTYGVPKSTIIDHVNKNLGVPGRKQDIPPEIEEAIVGKVLYAAKCGMPITKKRLLKKIGEAAKTLKLKTRFQNDIPSDMYWRRLKKRHPELALRVAEVLPTCRMKMVSNQVINDYFDALQDLLSRTGLEDMPSAIWNCDETGIRFQHEPARVVAGKGQRSVTSPASQNKENITIMATISASGAAMPPMVIVKGKTSRSLHTFATLDAPPDTVWTFQESGWITDAICLQWFSQIFLRFCGPQRPQLLLLDSHRSHERIELLDMAKKENIHVLALPPHTTHMLQPLDRTIFGPLKKNYNTACSDFLSENPGNAITKITWPRIFRCTWEKTLRDTLIRKAFQSTGVWPCNRDAIPTTAVLPSTAYQCSNDTTAADTATAISTATVTSTATAAATSTATSTARPTATSTATTQDAAAITVTNPPAETTRPVSTDVNRPIAEETTSVMLDHSDTLLSCFTEVFFDHEPAAVVQADESTSDIDRLLGQVSGHNSLELEPVANWSTAVDELFSVPKVPPKSASKTKRKLPITTFRLLTSNEVMEEKNRLQEEKERKEQAKEERRQKKMKNKL